MSDRYDRWGYKKSSYHPFCISFRRSITVNFDNLIYVFTFLKEMLVVHLSQMMGYRFVLIYCIWLNNSHIRDSSALKNGEHFVLSLCSKIIPAEIICHWRANYLQLLWVKILHILFEWHFLQYLITMNLYIQACL